MKALHGYRIQIIWSEPDSAYEASLPALGCIAYGTTPRGALRELETAARLWLAAAKVHGKPLPKPDVPSRVALV